MKTLYEIWNKLNWEVQYWMRLLGEESDDFYLEMKTVLEEAKINHKLAMRNITNVDFQIDEIRRGNHDVMYKILKLPGRNINLKNTEGVTPLMAAFETDNFLLAEALMEDDADIHATDNYERTPISYAIRNNHWNCVECFRSYLEINMIEYSFSEEHTNHLIDLANATKMHCEPPIAIFAPLTYLYNIDVTLRSGKKVSALIVSHRTFKNLVEHLQWMSEHKKDDFFTGPNFAFRPKDVASVTLVTLD